MFGFQRLNAYQDSITFLAEVTRLAKDLPRGHSDLVDQLRRAALSVPLNIAEGSGKFSRDAVRFYTIARGSALECAAILDAAEVLEIMEAGSVVKARGLLEGVVAMLTGLIRA